MGTTAPIDRTCSDAVELASMIGQKEHDDVDNDVRISIINWQFGRVEEVNNKG